MAKELTLQDLSKNFNVWTEDPEIIKLKNPVLNGMFHGGLPKGSVIQIAAQSGVGKSTLAVQVARELCEIGKNVLYIDVEKGLNKNMLESMGILKFLNNQDTTKGGNFIIVKEFDCGKVNNLIQQICDNGLADAVILDSLGALDSGIYKSDSGVDADNPKVGADTKSIKIIMKTINGCAMTFGTTFICINHLAQSIGSYIPTESPTGGRAPVYLSDIIIKLTKKTSEFEKLKVGQKVEFEAIKSRYGAGKAKIPFYIRFGKGIAMIPTYREVLDNHPEILETRGGGTGSLFLNGQEFKFRGDNQLLQLIAEHYHEIKDLITWEDFTVKLENLPDWIKVNEHELDDKPNTTLTISDLPEELSSIPVYLKENNIIYFKKGIDATGQEYSIYYDNKKERLTLDYNTSQGESTNNPSLEDYTKLEKKLEKYLKKCEKEMETK